MKHKLIFMRGLPGSGKSTKASQLAHEVYEASDGKVVAAILSTDDYFMCGPRYLFDAGELKWAHAWNLRRAMKLMKVIHPLIIIDNTNLQLWEMREYVRAAVDKNYDIEFCAPDTWWANSVPNCAEENTHGVPREKIEEMAARYEPLPPLDHPNVIRAILDSRAPWEKEKTA